MFMRIHVTNVYGFSIRTTVLQSQHEVVDILKDLCDSEIGLFRYYNEEEPKNELSSRLDGVIARLNAGDVVIFQSPTWNGVDWDNALVDKIKLYGGRVVFFIQDVPPIQFENNYFLMPYFIDMYNKAEVVVVPSEKMYQRLVEEGLTVKKYVVQKMWDFNVHMDLHTPSFEKNSIF